MKPIKAILIGAGQRGRSVYGQYILNHNDDIKIVAVFEPNDERREAVKIAHGLSDNQCYTDFKMLENTEIEADCAIIATQDNYHMPAATLALNKNYHLLLEKPISKNANELLELQAKAKKANKIVTVCHVLRYTPFFVKVKQLIDSGDIGDVVSVSLIENVGYWHQAHSFVRGNWNKSEQTSPMILAKSCHDMDILSWIVNSSCKSVSSFGSLMHFNAEHAPIGATKYCFDGCPHLKTCPYSAEKIYIYGTGVHMPIIRKVVSLTATDQSVRDALKNGPYGRCVYHCDNDVVDHQVVNLCYESGATAAFTMCGFTQDGGRTIKIMGTHGQIVGDVEKNTLSLSRFGDEKSDTYDIYAPQEGHSGGDVALMDDFISQLRQQIDGRSSLEHSIESHLVALAAELSRTTGKTVEMSDFV